MAIPSTARPSSSGWRWALLGACIGIAFALAVFAPARWLAAGLAQWSDRPPAPDQCARHGLERHRPAWCSPAAAGGAESISLPGPLGWTLRPRWDGIRRRARPALLRGKPLACRHARAPAALELDWRDGQSRWPAAMLAGFGAPWNTLKPEGALDLATQALVLECWSEPLLALAGRATLDATDISSSLSTLQPMGSYRLALDGGPAPHASARPPAKAACN